MATPVSQKKNPAVPLVAKPKTTTIAASGGSIRKGDKGDRGEKGDRGDQGPQGIPGSSGGSLVTYTFIQGVPDSVWNIVHNLNCRPSVTVEDSAGTIVDGFQFEYVDDNRILLTFNGVFSGKAYLN